MRPAGLSLVLAGLLGVLFFWLTDPRYGLGRFGGSASPVDAANEAFVGTVIGLAGSAIVLGLGLWLAARRTA